MASRRWWGAALILLGLLTVLVFIPGLSDEFTWDDNGLIRTNENIQRPEHYREALTTHFWNVSKDAVEANETYSHLYRPLVTLAYIVQYRLFGLHALGYRVVSLALHLLCCVLAFFWLARRLPKGSEAHRLVAISLGAGVFALHPSRVEAVSWISGSTELWMCTLVLLGALAFDSKRNWLAGILLALALFAKESAVIAAPLLLADRFLIRGRRDRAASVALITPAVMALLARIWIVDVELPLGEVRDAVPRVLASFGLYAQQVVAPWNPTAFPGMRIYSCEAGESLPAAWWIGGAFFVGATAALGIVALRRKEWRPVFADALWLVVPLLPVVNLLDLGSRNLTTDRFLYLPMLGVAAISARGVLWLLDRRPAMGKVSAIAIAMLIVGFAVVTSLHSRVFASSSSFWEYEVQRNPDNPFALHAVGIARTRAGLRNTGLEFLEHAQTVAEGTCVHTDQVRAAKDLGWALSSSTGPSDREALSKLDATYTQVPVDGRFEYDGPSGWSVQLTPEETRDLVSGDLHYALPRATIEARLGHVDEAMAILGASEIGGSKLHPQSQSLRLQLLAAQGHVRQSLIELARQRYVADLESLTSVLATLHETLAHARIAPEDQADWARFALGFGQTTIALATLSPRDRAILEALRAYSTDKLVDIEALQSHVAGSKELPLFIRLAQAKAATKQLDAQLL
jgi:hypothetical protein